MKEIGGKLKKVTGKAILIEIEGQDEWFPLSQVRNEDGDEFESSEAFSEEYRIGNIITINVPEWLARERGLD